MIMKDLTPVAYLIDDKLAGPIESQMHFAFDNGQEFDVFFKGSFSLQLAV